MNLFTKDEKKYMGRSLVSIGATEKGQFLLQMRPARTNYFFWKNKLSEVNKNIVDLKKAKTRAYLACRELGIFPFTEDLQSINQKLFWWRNYYPEALKCYRSAKSDYYMVQRLYSRFDEKQQAESKPSARALKGKFSYQMTVSRGDWKRVYFIRSDSDYLDKNNFKDEFEYDMDLAVGKYGEKLKAYNWNAYWTLFTLYNFYKGQDVKVDIKRAPLTAEPENESVLIDFAAFDTWRADKAVDSTRLTFEEFVGLKKKELGDGACVGFGAWFVSNRRKVLEKQYRGREARDITFSMKKTLRYWNKFYDKWAIEFMQNLEDGITWLSKS